VNGITCFIATDSGRARVSLRRYSPRLACQSSPLGYHNIKVPIDVVASPFNSDRREYYHDPYPRPEKDDPRWPSRCRCGYDFSLSDDDQIFHEQLYRYETGKMVQIGTQDELPAGAMIQALWVPNTWVGEDGRSWLVRLPGGEEWLIDAPASDGGRWKRTGNAPQFTVEPSILTPKYHGWLRNGVLVPA